MQCTNCLNTFEGRFCPACGQSARSGRITGSYVLHEMPHSILHVDKGLFHTMKELFVRPASTIAGYLAGQRAKHFKPLAYVVVLSALSSFVAHLVRGYLESHNDLATITLERTGVNVFIASVAPFFNHYQNVFYFLMIPIISLVTWAFFHKRYNYWEHIVVNTFLTAQFNLLLIAGHVFSLWNSGSFSLTPMLVLFFAYLAVVYSKLFAEPPAKRTSIGRTSAAIILVGLLYMTGLSFTGIMTIWWG
jgi:hypothetical protein